PVSLELVDADARLAARVGLDGRRPARQLHGRAVEEVREAVVPLWHEPDRLYEAPVSVLLLEVRLLGGERVLQVRLRLALLGARLELDEVRDGDRRKNADNRNDDHHLDELKALLQSLPSCLPSR